MTLTKIDDRGLKTPIDLLDNEKIRLGTDVDLQLYSDNSNAVITAAGSGDLQLTSTNDDVVIQAQDNIFINPQGGEDGLKVYGDGGVKLYYANSLKFETTTGGCKISGTNLNMNSTYIDFSGSISTPQTAAAIYRPADNTLAFSTANTHRMTINNTGVGINTDTPDTLLHVSGDQTAVLRLENTTGLGQDELIGAVEFEKQDGSGAGAGIVGGMRCRSDDSYGARTYIAFSTRGNSSDQPAVDTERFRILSQGGVTFNGDTAETNALADYEEGNVTWASNSTSNGWPSDFTIGNQNNSYTKIGNLVTIRGGFTIGNSSGTVSQGNYFDFDDSSLPFTVINKGAGTETVQTIGRFFIYQVLGGNVNASGDVVLVHGGYLRFFVTFTTSPNRTNTGGITFFINYTSSQ